MLQMVPPLRTLLVLNSISQSLLAQLADLRALSLVAITSLVVRLRPIFTSMYIFSSFWAFSAMKVRNLNSLRFLCSSRKSKVLRCDWTHSIGPVPFQDLTLSLLVGSRVSSDCNFKSGNSSAAHCGDYTAAI
jgi:hypothetical protein